MKSDQKIIHIIGSLDHGGAECFVTDLCNEMARKNDNVILVSLCDNRSADSLVDQISDKVKYVSFSKKRGLSLPVMIKLTAWLSGQRPAVVHSHLNSIEYLVLYHLLSRKTSFFHTLHNIAEAECPELLIKLFRKILYSYNKVVPVTISLACSHSYRRYYQLRNDQLIENARQEMKPTYLKSALLEQYKNSDAEVLLVHVGRISSEKNQQLLIAAVKQLNLTEKKKCRLLLIGEIKDEGLFCQLRAFAKSDPRIEFLGLRKNIVDYLSIADAFCLSSHWEGMPISLIEAMSVGCIPVCTAVGGIPDMITDNVNGFLCMPDNTAAYVEALKKIIYPRDLERIREQTVSTYYQRYTISSAAAKHLNMYQGS